MTSADSVPTRALNDGSSIPAVGFGTWPLKGAEAEEGAADALRAGYRLVDTAANYGNETEVGRGIAGSGVPREEVVVTTKLPGRHHGHRATLDSFEESRRRLGVERVDLYLIHWPLPRIDQYVASWQAMIELRERGAVRSIGVSNFTPEHLGRLEDETGVLPAVNQVEMHPLFPQDELRAFHAEKGIVTESWSPLGRGGELLDDPAIVEVARAHGVTPGQAVLRWHLQLDAVPIPKSGGGRRRRDNIDLFGFELSDDEMAAVGDRSPRRLGGDPEHHEEF
ncbi:aldo/keto reductase [Streptomyces sp. NPDC050560]|uniref:aldo/keto reductase n=1 Tax=Streptomyces sp. NPDC050560 TaxID=3365630 RepID=UPI0037A87241